MKQNLGKRAKLPNIRTHVRDSLGERLWRSFIHNASAKEIESANEAGSLGHSLLSAVQKVLENEPSIR